MWLDAGPGTLANLQLHVDLGEVDAIVLTHEHPDHWSDLEHFVVAWRWYSTARRVPVYAPPRRWQKEPGASARRWPRAPRC